MYDTRTKEEVDKYRENSKKKLETLFVEFEDLVNRDVQENDLKIDNKDSVNYNDLLEIAEKSFFRVVYKQAFEQVNMIVHQNQSKSQHDIQNIIAFTGRRGTGKTSAMLSIVNCLQDCNVRFDDMKVNSKFQKLAEINAANIDEYANIMSEVLTQIIKFIDKKTDDIKSERRYEGNLSEKYHEFRNKACELLNRYNRCCSTAAVKNSDNSNFLNIVSGKLSFKEDFRKFMKDLSYAVFSDNDSYFVICIDDIDVAPSGHADILKSIQTYLMIPNVIVMVTMELSFLIPEIRRNFYQNMEPTSEPETIGKVSLEQTGEYLKKILPSDNRITMPSWRKKDYAEMLPIKLNMGNKDVRTKFKNAFPKLEKCEFSKFMEKHDKENYQITPKDLILMMIANRTKIYFDAKGHKYHFFEPMSLRNMYDLFYFLYNMNNVVPEYDELHPHEKSGGDIPKNNMYYLHRTENRKRLLDYIHFTMRRDMHFNGEDDDFIDALISQPIERRGKMIWERYYTILGNREKKYDVNGTVISDKGNERYTIADRIIDSYGWDYYNDQRNRHDVNNYSFGELFRILFTSTRTGIFDNKLVKFIMATYTVALPAFVENEKHEEKWAYSEKFPDGYEPDKGNYKKLVDLYGSSLLGSWCDDLFGRKDGNTTRKCYIRIIKKSQIFISDVFRLVLYILMSSKIVKGEAILVKKILVDTYEFETDVDPTSFLINALWMKKNDKNVMFDFQDLTKSESKTTMSMYEVLSQILENGFIKPDSDFNKYFDPNNLHYENSFYNKLSDYENKKLYGNNVHDIIECMINILIRDYDEFHLSNMLKHMDLTYNVIKRSLTDMIYVTPHDVIKREAPFESIPKNIINRFYNKVSEHLEENDNIYFSGVTNNTGEDGQRHFFSKRFRNSILYKIFCTDDFNGSTDTNAPSDSNDGEDASSTSSKDTIECRIASDGSFVDLSLPSIVELFFKDEDCSSKGGNSNVVTLKKVFDNIQSPNIYLIYYSEFLSALRGAFAPQLNMLLTSEQSFEITTAIYTRMNNFIDYEMTTDEKNKPEENNDDNKEHNNGDDKKLTNDDKRKSMIKELNNSIADAIAEIRKILGLE